MIKELIKLANRLDNKGFAKEADYLDGVIIGLTKKSGFNRLASTFQEAFREARDSGVETFMWNGEEYTTKTWEEDLPLTPSGRSWPYPWYVDPEGYLLPGYKGHSPCDNAVPSGEYPVRATVSYKEWLDEDDHDLKLRAGCHKRHLIDDWLEGLDEHSEKRRKGHSQEDVARIQEWIGDAPNANLPRVGIPSLIKYPR